MYILRHTQIIQTEEFLLTGSKLEDHHILSSIPTPSLLPRMKFYRNISEPNLNGPR